MGREPVPIGPEQAGLCRCNSSTAPLARSIRFLHGRPMNGRICFLNPASLRRVLWLGLVMAAWAQAQTPAPAITRIGDIRRLPREEAAKALPVKISGTCIFAANDESFVHDGSHGIWVSSLTARSRELLRDDAGLAGLTAGKTVEIEGFTDAGSFAPQVLPVRFRQTGSADLPVPVKISTEKLISGSEDGQWVELDGVIQKIETFADRTVCTVMVNGTYALATLVGEARRNLPPLIDANVRVIGAFAPDFNNRGETMIPKIVSSTAGSIHVTQAPPADPFARPRVPLNRLRAFSPDASPFHRKVTSGVVTFVRPGSFFFLGDGSTSIRVVSDATDVRPGWRVDVAGFIALSQHLAALKSGVVRKTGEEELPPPPTVTARDLLSSASWQRRKSPSSSDFSGQNVSLSGRIDRKERSAHGGRATVWIESDSITFPVFLPPGPLPSENFADKWQAGAEVRLTGACELNFPNKPDPLGLYEPDGFRIWLASPDDLIVIRPASWWTPRRLSIALSATGLSSLAAIGLVALLRRQIHQQVGIIARELETNAVATERERMARDLHDTLEQQLTGVAMQLEGLAKSPQGQSPDFSSRLTLATRMIQHSREEARRSVWDLRNKVLENHGFVAALESLAASAAIDGGPHVTTRVSGSHPQLPPVISYQLLRMTQEALANALKHARAQNIRIELETSPPQCHLAIIDDGCGFDADLVHPPAPPHFGLIGIRERASKIGAQVEIRTQPGSGCTVIITLPLATP